MMSEALADEVAPFGIAVSAVCPSGVRTDFLDNRSMKRPAKHLPQYETVAQTMESLERFNHNQSGDPALVGSAITTLAAMEHMPRRLYLGCPAVGALQAHIQQLVDDVNEHIDLSLSIDRK